MMDQAASERRVLEPEFKAEAVRFGGDEFANGASATFEGKSTSA